MLASITSRADSPPPGTRPASLSRAAISATGPPRPRRDSMVSVSGPLAQQSAAEMDHGGDSRLCREPHRPGTASTPPLATSVRDGTDGARLKLASDGRARAFFHLSEDESCAQDQAQPWVNPAVSDVTAELRMRITPFLLPLNSDQNFPNLKVAWMPSLHMK